jgi:serine/threonine protein kinase
MPNHFQFTVGQAIRSAPEHYYRTLQLLGEGKNASAYLVLATSAERKGTFYALKVLQDPSDEERRIAFEQERDFLLALDHPSITRIVDQGTFTTDDGPRPFYVSDYYATTLEAIIRRGCSLPQKLGYALQLSSAVGYLAQLEEPIIHCDIKPGNIFVDGLTCVLADFGLVRGTGNGALANLGPSLHTYRSPDIVANLQNQTALTPKSDVFQLGLTLAELFTGRNPCRPAAHGSDPLELEDVPEIHGIVGERIHNLISWMLKLQPYDRPTASYTIDIWQGILFDAVDHLRKVEPHVF